MRLALAGVALVLVSTAAASWKVTEGPNPDGPGQAVDARQDGQLVARLVYGQGQIKPYLHLFDESGRALTNPGLDKEGKPLGQYPHHRGIFIGWKVVSELGTDDLWHLRGGCKMEVAKLRTFDGNKDRATISADIDWRSAKSTNDSDLLLRETRTLNISRPSAKRTQVDALFTLKAARDLRFEGDLQHSGVHFRAANEVRDREKETFYLTEPDALRKGDNLKWCRLIFPIGDRWYSALQLNAPENPVQELSTRSYGRFGYFFKKALAKGDELQLRYRFVIDQIEAPANAPRPAPGQTEQWRADAQKLYENFTAGR